MKKWDLGDFVVTYHKQVDDNDPIYQAFLKIVDDPNQVNLFVTLNGQYELAPADVFCRLNPLLCQKLDLANNDAEKRLLGALFGYLFRFMLGTPKQMRAVSKRIADPTKRKHKRSGDVLYDSKGHEVYLMSASYFKRTKQ